ncbi:MAG: hypothetical protein P1U87_08775 [Verrucomicrobiales bacterium]|nr:hypothetical protein [Verrucomicrobiales bacterium]
MTTVEDSLRLALGVHPEDWAIRFLLIEKAMDRNAPAEAVQLVVDAPIPPSREEELHRIVELAGVDCLPLVNGFVQKHPANGYGHQMLGSILRGKGEEEVALQHFQVAESLGIYSNDEYSRTSDLTDGSGLYPEAVLQEEPTRGFIPLPVQASELQGVSEVPAEFVEPEFGEPELPSQRGTKATAALVAVGFHVLIAVIAALVVILPQTQEEPEIVAMMVAPPQKKQEMQKKNVVKQTKKTSASSAAAAPLAQLMRANAMAKISLPNVTRTSKGPLGIGDADFGAGGFGSGTSGMGAGETMFGNPSGNGLIGSFYDLKQDRNRKATGITGDSAPKFNEVMQKAARSKFAPSAFSSYFKAPMELRFGMLAIPTMDANQGPAAFAVEKEVQPKAWLVHYTGRVAPPARGKWRFVGYFDDALVVFVNGKVVLDASWMPCFNEKGVRQPFGGPALANGKPAVFGNWVDLQGPFQIDILVGERPGGQMGGALLAQEERGRYDKRKDGTPILPIFSTGKVEGESLKRLKAFPYQFAKEEAIFRTVSGGF